MTVTWPSVLKPTDFGYSLVDADISGGRALGGGEQFVSSAGSYWNANMTLSVRTNEQVLALRALRSSLMGRAGSVELPNFDGRRVSWPVEAGTGRVLTPRVARQLAGTAGLEGTSWAGPDIPAASEIIATVASFADVRSTTILVDVSQGGPILPGQQFGIGKRLYEVTAALGSVPVGGVTTFTLTFTPPLRVMAPGGDPVLFTRPVCLMRCMNMADEFRPLSELRFATLNLQFVEYL